MITAGIDIGAKNSKVLILKDGQVLAKGMVLTGFDQRASAEEAFEAALKQAGISRDQIERIVATGVGKDEAPYAEERITEVTAAAKGAVFLVPSARTVIDVGGEEGRALRCDESGRVIDFAINEKCAAGAGAFVEAMARALEVSLDEFAQISLKSEKTIPMNAQCAVFAESEVVSLIHAKVPKHDIARAVHDAIADRIISMTRRVGVEKDVVLVGGMARNVGFVDAMKRGLGMDVIVPEDPEFVGALGAALAAAGR